MCLTWFSLKLVGSNGSGNTSAEGLEAESTVVLSVFKYILCLSGTSY